jgi:uncharacterized LabA/DUF88 family protein
VSSPLDRVVFLTDGFNLYHSIRKARSDLIRAKRIPPSLKWLDLRALCTSYMHLLGKNAVLADVYYFSALATHLEAFKPDVVARHQILIDALLATGVRVELGRFKEKKVWCETCRRDILRHEEKETDVAISLKLLELFFTEGCDTVVFITGDTDVAPAVRTAKKYFPTKRVLFAFPYARKNKELANIAPESFTMSYQQYAKYQFPNSITLEDGRIITKPKTW